MDQRTLDIIEHTPILEPYTLRWCEPFGGGLSLEDTGLCNRLFHWEVAYELNKRNNFKFTILVEGEFWRELEYLDLPYTKVVHQKHGEHHLLHQLKFKTVYNIDTQSVYMSEPLNKEKMDEMVTSKNFDLSDKTHLYADFGYNYVNTLHKMKPRGVRGLQKIEFKNYNLADMISRYVKGCIGIHIRRGEGVYRTTVDIKSLPKKIREELGVSEKDPVYRFYSDELYFNFIDKVLEKNPNQRFYISCDLPYDQYSYYVEKYGEDQILTRYNLVKQVVQYGETLGVLDTFDIQALINILDLFSLSYCNFIVRSLASTWSEFSQIYNNSPYGFIHEDLDELVAKVEPFLGEEAYHAPIKAADKTLI